MSRRHYSDTDSTPSASVPRDRTRLSKEQRGAHRRRNAAPDWFACVHCGKPITAEASGTAHRNHCPHCLWSRHMDAETPGDRESECRSAMEPIAVWARPGGDWAILHRCRGCGTIHSNRIAGDDNELLLVALAVRALAQPPFPLARVTAPLLAVDGDILNQDG